MYKKTTIKLKKDKLISHAMLVNGDSSTTEINLFKISDDHDEHNTHNIMVILN